MRLIPGARSRVNNKNAQAGAGAGVNTQANAQEIAALNKRIRTMIRGGLLLIAVTMIVSGLVHGWWQMWFKGLVIGEFGGAYVVYSLVRQGHLNDGLEGQALFAAGVVGMFMRWLVLGIVLFIAYKLHANLVSTLLGYVLGFVHIFIGFTSYFRKPTDTSAGK